MKRWVSCFLVFLTVICMSWGQEAVNTGNALLFHGIVIDADARSPLAGSQIMINRAFASVSDNEGRFAFYVNRLDTVTFSMLGFKPAVFLISDTLKGREFIAGVYMYTDTLSIGEIVIVPRFRNLRSELLNPSGKPDQEIENAMYNLELSAYQGKISQGKLGDPASNYEYLRQKHRSEAYTKGQIPADRILGISPFMIIPAVYLLMNGFPEKPPPLQPSLTDQELKMIWKKYLDTYGNK